MATGRDLAHDLLARAVDDLAAARTLRGAPDVSDAIVGFHSQQAVEKALKAVLALGGVDFPHTHDLTALIELHETAGIVLPDELADIDLLTPFGVHLRYSTAEDAVLVTRETAVRSAEQTVDWARHALESS